MLIVRQAFIFLICLFELSSSWAAGSKHNLILSGSVNYVTLQGIQSSGGGATLKSLDVPEYEIGYRFRLSQYFSAKLTYKTRTYSFKVNDEVVISDNNQVATSINLGMTWHSNFGSRLSLGYHMKEDIYFIFTGSGTVDLMVDDFMVPSFQFEQSFYTKGNFHYGAQLDYESASSGDIVTDRSLMGASAFIKWGARNRGTYLKLDGGMNMIAKEITDMEIDHDEFFYRLDFQWSF